MRSIKILINFLIIFILFSHQVVSQKTVKNPDIDEKVKKFLKNERNSWVDMNVPESDGKILYDIIIKNNWQTVSSH